MTTDSPSAVEAAWQNALALEHEAVWWYALVGGRRAGLKDRARTSHETHRTARDRLSAQLAEDGIALVGAALSYGSAQIPDDAAARARSQDVERRLASAYLLLAGMVTGERRRQLVTDLRRSARAHHTWGGSPVAFPGLD